MIDQVEASARPIVDDLASRLPATLGADLVGLYLHGSAVTGGFDAGVSDIDLVAVTARGVDELDLDAVDRLHRSVLDGHPDWEDRLEVVYVPRSALQEPTSSSERVAVISPGEPFHVTGPASDWAMNWYLLRESCVRLLGPPPRGLIGPISTDEFLSAVTGYADYLRTRSHDHPGSLAYAVVSACRALATVSIGRPVSKQEGAAWVTGQLPEWSALIGQALAARLTRGASGFTDQRSRAEAVRLVRLLAARVSATGRPRP